VTDVEITVVVKSALSFTALVAVAEAVVEAALLIAQAFASVVDQIGIEDSV
jgi:hypothetical protein